MKVQYYSDVTGKLYETEEACVKAEQEVLEAKRKEEEAKEAKEAARKEREKKAGERKTRADEIEEARKAMVASQRKYRELVNKFCEDYGTYHYSTSSFDGLPTLFDTLDNLFRR